jgi:hypothetical protein
MEVGPWFTRNRISDILGRTPVENHEWTPIHTNSEEKTYGAAPRRSSPSGVTVAVPRQLWFSFVSIRVDSWLNGIFPAERSEEFNGATACGHRAA